MKLLSNSLSSCCLDKVELRELFDQVFDLTEQAELFILSLLFTDSLDLLNDAVLTELRERKERVRKFLPPFDLDLNNLRNPVRGMETEDTFLPPRGTSVSQADVEVLLFGEGAGDLERSICPAHLLRDLSRGPDGSATSSSA